MINSSLEEAILNHEDIDLFDYYEKYIKPLDSRFEQYSYYDDKLVLCFFKDHNDINPSMGYINDRKHKGKHLYHCFGCGRTGDVIRLHQIIESQYHNRDLSRIEACKDLAELYGVDITEYNLDESNDAELRYVARSKHIDTLKNKYSFKEYSQSLLDIRLNNKNPDLSIVNKECIKLIATVKELYN